MSGASSRRGGQSRTKGVTSGKKSKAKARTDWARMRRLTPSQIRKGMAAARVPDANQCNPSRLHEREHGSVERNLETGLAGSLGRGTFAPQHRPGQIGSN